MGLEPNFGSDKRLDPDLEPIFGSIKKFPDPYMFQSEDLEPDPFAP